MGNHADKKRRAAIHNARYESIKHPDIKVGDSTKRQVSHKREMPLGTKNRLIINSMIAMLTFLFICYQQGGLLWLANH